ncbi:MAG: LysR family transcriptional regulator [Roseivivax sp.]|nr:LysR family transcriptional regulator [Roseivivax sp.]
MRRLDQITLKQLRALHTVAAEGTISAAAHRLGLTGPAVHNQLKTLEELIGSRLLENTASGRNAPTPQGQALLDAHDEIRAALTRSIGRIQALDAGYSGSVVLGVVSTAKYFAPRIVALLKRQMPEVEIVLKVGNRQETIDALDQGEFDLCIMGRPPRKRAMEARALGDHPHVLIAAASHPMATLDRVPRDALLNERFVMREPGSGTRILAARFLEDIGQGLQPATVEMSSNETIKQAVINELGIAIISAHTVAEELRSGRLVALRADGLPIMRAWYLLSRQDHPLTRTAEQVRDWITAHVDDFLPRI